MGYLKQPCAYFDQLFILNVFVGQSEHGFKQNLIQFLFRRAQKEKNLTDKARIYSFIQLPFTSIQIDLKLVLEHMLITSALKRKNLVFI